MQLKSKISINNRQYVYRGSQLVNAKNIYKDGNKLGKAKRILIIERYDKKICNRLEKIVNRNIPMRAKFLSPEEINALAKRKDK